MEFQAAFDDSVMMKGQQSVHLVNFIGVLRWSFDILHIFVESIEASFPCHEIMRIDLIDQSFHLVCNPVNYYSETKLIE